MIDRDAPLSGGWREVYAACDVDTSIEPELAHFFILGGRHLAKAQERRPTEGTVWTPLPSNDERINVALDSSGATVRRGSGSRALRETSMHEFSGAYDGGESA